MTLNDVSRIPVRRAIDTARVVGTTAAHGAQPLEGEPGVRGAGRLTVGLAPGAAHAPAADARAALDAFLDPRRAESPLTAAACQALVAAATAQPFVQEPFSAAWKEFLGPGLTDERWSPAQYDAAARALRAAAGGSIDPRGKLAHVVGVLEQEGQELRKLAALVFHPSHSVRETVFSLECELSERWHQPTDSAAKERSRWAKKLALVRPFARGHGVTAVRVLEAGIAYADARAPVPKSRRQAVPMLLQELIASRSLEPDVAAMRLTVLRGDGFDDALLLHAVRLGRAELARRQGRPVDAIPQAPDALCAELEAELARAGAAESTAARPTVSRDPRLATLAASGEPAPLKRPALVDPLAQNMWRTLTEATRGLDGRGRVEFGIAELDRLLPDPDGLTLSRVGEVLSVLESLGLEQGSRVRELKNIARDLCNIEQLTEMPGREPAAIAEALLTFYGGARILGITRIDAGIPEPYRPEKVSAYRTIFERVLAERPLADNARAGLTLAISACDRALAVHRFVDDVHEALGDTSGTESQRPVAQVIAFLRDWVHAPAAARTHLANFARLRDSVVRHSGVTNALYAVIAMLAPEHPSADAWKAAADALDSTDSYGAHQAALIRAAAAALSAPRPQQ